MIELMGKQIFTILRSKSFLIWTYASALLLAVLKVKSYIIYKTILFVCFVFVALRPMSTAMVIAGRSVHLTTLFPGQA